VFPFLIGTVRTKFKQSYAGKGEGVSIPHRYGKNTQKSLLSYVGGKTFPFLIGTVRTMEHHKYHKYSYRVSIPHRYGKNSIHIL